jgi:hypothetical protein
MSRNTPEKLEHNASSVLLFRYSTFALIGLALGTGSLAYAVMTIEGHQTVILRTIFFGSIARLLWTFLAVRPNDETCLCTTG